MRRIHKLLPCLTVLVLWPAIVFAASENHRVNAGASQDVNEWAVCKKVVNASGNDLFVPTKTSVEWTAFRSNPPAGVTLGSCVAVFCDGSDTCNAGMGETCVTCPSECTACAPCNLPWGGTVVSGSSTTAYAAPSVPCGSSCSSQARLCTNGSLSGTYLNQSCSVSACDPRPAECASCGGGWDGSACRGPKVCENAEGGCGERPTSCLDAFGGWGCPDYEHDCRNCCDDNGNYGGGGNFDRCNWWCEKS